MPTTTRPLVAEAGLDAEEAAAVIKREGIEDLDAPPPT
jgi:hypothetical protein